MATNAQHSTSLPLQEKIVDNNKLARSIELVILSLFISLLVYRVILFKDQEHYLPWLLAFMCESWLTLNWILSLCTKWNQCTTITYPERLLKSENELEFPAVDILVTTADSILEPPIITMNTILSLLAVDYPVDKLVLYLSDDGCSPLTFYSLVETVKFAKLWVSFCKKYNVQVRAPFRYFTPESTPLEDDSLEFKKKWKKMKNEYEDLYNKIELASKSPFQCDHNSDFGVFCNVNCSDHPSIIKVISENQEGTKSEIPQVIYISREKSPQHHHHYKAGAMNVLTRVSGVMTNAPLMLNVDCDMYANNPQVFLHAMCLVFGLQNEQDCGFIQFPATVYNGLKDDPFGNQFIHFYFIANGIASIQGPCYEGSNCFHKRKVIYGASPNDTIKAEKMDLHKIFGKSSELRKSAAEVLSGSNATIENRRSPSSLIEEAVLVAGCSYEYGTNWGTHVGWLYGSTTEDLLTGLCIHARGWKSTITYPEPLAFLGCAPLTYPCTLKQQKRWATGFLEIFFSSKNPFLLFIKGKIWFRQALAYFWICSWPTRSVLEICYATLPAYCILTNTRFLPNINEPGFLIPLGIFVIYYLYVLLELKCLGLSLRMWWNLQRIGRVNPMTSWLFGFLSVMLKLTGFSKTIVFEVTRKEHRSTEDDDDAKVGRFTYDNSPVIMPGVLVLLVNLIALVNGMSRLLKGENWIGVTGLGEMFCSVWVLICFWEFFKGLFANGKNGIPFSTIWKSGALALFFVHLCTRSSQVL